MEDDSFIEEDELKQEVRWKEGMGIHGVWLSLTKFSVWKGIRTSLSSSLTPTVSQY